MSYSPAYTDLAAALTSRGYGHQAATIAEHLDAGAQELWHEAAWDFRRVSITGAAPLDIGDLGALVKHVSLTATGETLVPTTESEHLDTTAGGTTAGTPNRYYIPDDEHVYLSPTATDSITVIAYDARPWLLTGTPQVAVGDTSRIPQPYLDILLLLAEIRAMREDNRHTDADALRAGPELTSRLSQMKDAMLTTQRDEPRKIPVQSLY